MLPRVALNQQEAAAALGISVNHFKKHVRHKLRATYIGGCRRYRVTELQRYCDEASVYNPFYPRRSDA